VESIGKYRIESLIATGGMGVVYKAWDPYFERRVAVKVLSDALCRDPEFRTRFFREGRSMARLDHASIIAVYDLGEEEGRPYLALEYLEGCDLRTELARGGDLPLERRLSMMLEVTAGLAYAHRMGVVHRDVKPGNIFVTTSAQVKILDFGLARVSGTTLTRKGSLLGTPAYMAPEQWEEDAVDHRVDVFAAGAVFYELLAGCRAFDGDTYEAIFYNVLHTEPGPVDPRIPPELIRIVLRALAKKAADRYPDLDEMLRDLEAFESLLAERKRGLRVEAGRALDRLEQLVREHRARLAADPATLDESPLARGMLRPPDRAEEGNPTVRRVPADYLELLDLVRAAEREHRALGRCLGLPD
jgi:serine/threonine-protein kinase